MSILLPTYHKVISNSSYLSSKAQPDLFEMHDSHGLPVGPPRFWGGHRSIKTARPGEKSTCILYLCDYVFVRTLFLCLHFVIVYLRAHPRLTLPYQIPLTYATLP